MISPLRFLAVIATLAVLPGLTSCAVSGGNSPVSSSEPHAIVTTKRIVKSPFPLVMSTTVVAEIDGQRPAFVRWDDTFRISPGVHRFTLQNINYNTGAMTVMELNARAGNKYTIQSDSVGELKVKFWIEDSAGKVVASKLSQEQFRPVAPTPIFIPIPAG